MKDLNDFCFEFQQKIINYFNEEQNLPFLLKYYLVKEIWENIENNKIQLDLQVRNRQSQKTTEISTMEQQDSDDSHDGKD